MNIRSLLTAAAVFAALLSGAAQATPVHYSESVSGDLASLPSAGFLFDIGNNTISGTTRFLSFVEPEPDCHFCTDSDSFIFTLPINTKLASISYSFDLLIAHNVSIAASGFRLCVGDFSDPQSCFQNPLGFEPISYLGDSLLDLDFGGALPLSSGTYTIQSAGGGIGILDPSIGSMGWSADYKWTFRVTPIPEPSSLPLAAIALGGLGLVTLRRKS